MNLEEFRYCPRCGQKLEVRPLEGSNRKICPACKWVGYENPLPCAAALVRNDAGEILLVRRGVEPARGEWALPSGFMEIGETPEECCLRELEEETGLKGKIARLVGVYAQDSVVYKRVLIIGYEVKAQGVPSPGSDSEEVAYFPPDKIPPIAFSSHRCLVADFLSSQGENILSGGGKRREKIREAEGRGGRKKK